MYIAWARAQFKINKHLCWNWQLCIPDRLSIVQFRFSHVIGILFLTQFLWTFGSWRCWLSLEKRSSIPARSTIIYRFLCKFPCARVSTLNQQIYKYVCMNVCLYVYIYTVWHYWMNYEGFIFVGSNIFFYQFDIMEAKLNPPKSILA